MNITDSKRFEQNRDHRTACQSSTIIGQKLHQSAMVCPETKERALGGGGLRNLFGSVLVKRFLKRDQIICGSEKLKMQLLQTLYIAQLAPARAPDTMPHLLTMWAVQFPQVTYSPHAERDFASF
ncbi:hypothetical protein ACSQ67_008197 [Phaseolus vulgaris]